MNRPLQYAILLTVSGLSLASCSDTREPTAPSSGDQPVTAGLALAAGHWTEKAAMPTGRTALAAAVASDSRGRSLLFAIGGDDGNGVTLSKVEAYNFAGNGWSTKAPLPANLEETDGAAVIGNRIYVSGGRDLDNSSPGSDDGAPRASLYVYDPVANSWTTLTRCPNPHFRGAAAVIDGKLYVAGGEHFTSSGPFAIKRLHVYDPGTDTWTQMASLPRGVSSTAGARLLGQFYVLGGTSNDHGRDFVQAYDPASNTWVMKAPLPTFRTGLAAAGFASPDDGRRIVAVGGFGGEGDRFLRSNDVFTP